MSVFAVLSQATSERNVLEEVAQGVALAPEKEKVEEKRQEQPPPQQDDDVRREAGREGGREGGGEGGREGGRREDWWERRTVA